MKELSHSRIGYDLIINEIPRNARVLDLGCGDGNLLAELVQSKNIDGHGVEISQQGVARCVEKGLYCYQGDIDEGLSNYKNNSYDYVILNQTLQNTKRPNYVLKETVRIGKYAIISFPNLGHFQNLLSLTVHGRMPVNNMFPWNWYETPDIHLLTIRDFKEYCLGQKYDIHQERHFYINRRGQSVPLRCMKSLRGMYGFFVLGGK